MSSKYKKYFKSRKRLVFFLLIALLGSQFLIQYIDTLWPKRLMVIVILIGLFLILLFDFSGKRKIAKNAFLIIAFMGISNSLIMPVRYNLDENTHYYNAMQVADGHFMQQSDEVNFLQISPDFLAVTKAQHKRDYTNATNTNLYSKDFFAIEHIDSDYKREWVNEKNTSLINPAYYPSALGIVIGRMFTPKLAVSYYMGRIFNVLFYAILVYIGISLSKKYKLQLFVIATVSYTMWISAGYSYDSLYYGLIIILMGQLTNFFAVGENSVTIKKMITYILLCSVLVLCKAPVILLIFLPLFFPKNFYRDKKQKLITFFLMLSGSILGGLWLIQGKILNLLPIEHSAPDAIKYVNESLQNVDAISRIFYFIRHPMDTVTMLFRSLSDVFFSIRSSISAPMPFISPSDVVGILNLLVFITLLIIVSSKIKFSIAKSFKVAVTIIAFAITFSIFFAITGDPRVFHLGDLRIEGVQGRYHFYLLALLPMIISNYIKNNRFLIIEEKYDLTNFVMQLSCCMAMLNTCVGIFAYL